MTAVSETDGPWLRRKLASFRFGRHGRWARAGGPDAAFLPFPTQSEPLFENPFRVEDMGVFDRPTLTALLGQDSGGVSASDLGRSAAGMTPKLRQRVRSVLSGARRRRFDEASRRRLHGSERQAAERRVLDALFWELTYWKTPELYEELTEGERLHPGIFRSLSEHLRDAVVLDAGAGSGRATRECVRHGARRVFAIEPSAGLLHLLGQKSQRRDTADRIAPLRGRFDALPLAGDSVDMAIACSSFTAEGGQGGDEGLRELLRVTRPGGRIIVIWPRVEDYSWLAERGFTYEALPLEREMVVRFRSLESAVRCAQRFYARRRGVLRYLYRHRRPEVPFSVLGFNPPHDYCWLVVPR